MSIEAISEPVETLLKQVFMGDSPDWPGEDDISEDTFIDALNFHGMTPVYWHWINQRGFCKNWPGSLLFEIKNIAMKEAASNLLIELELKKNLLAMDDIDIYPVLIKGTPLSYTLYSVPGLRPRCDTDLLIAKQEIFQVSRLMEQLGYHALYDAYGEHLSSQKTFVKKDKLKISHAYDIHWQCNNHSRSFSEELNYSYLLNSAIAIPKLGKNARSPNRIDALLLACFHRAGHFSNMGERLIWLYDIHLLAGALDEPQFNLFYQKAKRIEIVTICSDAILTAKEWFNTPISTAKLEQLNTLPESEASMAYLATGRQAGIKNHALLELKGLSSVHDKFRYLTQKVFPPVNYMLWRYNTNRKYLLPFLYLYRLIYGMYIFVGR